MEKEDSTAQFQLSLASDAPDLFRGRALDEDLSIQTRKATLRLTGDADLASPDREYSPVNPGTQPMAIGSGGGEHAHPSSASEMLNFYLSCRQN